MNESRFRRTWNLASTMDSTLSASQQQLKLLWKRCVHAISFSRDQMFEKMAERQIAIFNDLPIRVAGANRTGLHQRLVELLNSSFSDQDTNRVQVGPSQTLRSLPVGEIMRRWAGGRAVIGVTDLHFRRTRLEEMIDIRPLSDFNLIVRGSESLSLQEMMTFVIASRGNVTDSHTDDPDGTNHCFFGQKMWIAWDTFEGMNAGLEDVSRQDVYSQAAFNIDAFLKLKSACTFLVSDGQTLFMPGNYAHKVITLEPYLGLGSFNVSLPSSLDTLARWICHKPAWSLYDTAGINASLVNEFTQIVLQTAQRSSTASDRQKKQFGYDYLNRAYQVWNRSTNSKLKQVALSEKAFSQIVEIASQSICSI